MSRATTISRVVFGLLLLATFFAFFAAQKLKQTDPLVYSVSFKRYISPNDDGLREKGRVRFRIKQGDRVSVHVVDKSGEAIRALADNLPLAAGPHTFYWNGRLRGSVSASGRRVRGTPVPDGAYRVRITLHERGRSFVPDQYFVVDTEPPVISAEVLGAHQRSVLHGRTPVETRFAGAGDGLRAEFLVYRVIGSRAASRPVASFLSRRGTSSGQWDQQVGAFTRWADQCEGVSRKGHARPAPVGSYVIVARACDAGGNVGTSSSSNPPRRGSTRGASGVTLTGVQIAPPTLPARAGKDFELRVQPPKGGYSWRIERVGSGERVARGRARGKTLRAELPKVAAGLHELTIRALNPVPGDRGLARTPLPISRGRAKLLIVHPAIAWQASNPVDINGDGFGDPFELLPAGRQVRVSLERPLARQRGPVDFDLQDGALAAYLQTRHPQLSAQTTTDFALAQDPAAALRGHDAVLFTGDARWIPATLGGELRRFVLGGGKLAYFSLDAFRRTVTLSTDELAGPSEPRGRNIFGESFGLVREAPAPVVAFKDELGLLRGPTGLFMGFEQSRQLPRDAVLQTSAGRSAEAPALVAYSLGKGQVIRVGVRGWSAELAELLQGNVRWSTDAILEVLTR